MEFAKKALACVISVSLQPIVPLKLHLAVAMANMQPTLLESLSTTAFVRMAIPELHANWNHVQNHAAETVFVITTAGVMPNVFVYTAPTGLTARRQGAQISVVATETALKLLRVMAMKLSPPASVNLDLSVRIVQLKAALVVSMAIASTVFVHALLAGLALIVPPETVLPIALAMGVVKMDFVNAMYCSLVPTAHCLPPNAPTAATAEEFAQAMDALVTWILVELIVFWSACTIARAVAIVLMASACVSPASKALGARISHVLKIATGRTRVVLASSDSANAGLCELGPPAASNSAPTCVQDWESASTARVSAIGLHFPPCILGTLLATGATTALSSCAPTIARVLCEVFAWAILPCVTVCPDLSATTAPRISATSPATATAPVPTRPPAVSATSAGPAPLAACPIASKTATLH